MQDCLFSTQYAGNCCFILRIMDYQNSFDNFLSRGSTHATCKVWCKSVKLQRSSLIKYVFHLSRFCKWKVTANMDVAYATQFSSGTRRYSVQQCATYYVGFMGQKGFCIKNTTTCWSFLVCELQGPFCCTSLNFISISVMVWGQCQILNYMTTRAPPSGGLVNPSSAVLRRALTIIVLSFALIR